FREASLNSQPLRFSDLSSNSLPSLILILCLSKPQNPYSYSMSFETTEPKQTLLLCFRTNPTTAALRTPPSHHSLSLVSIPTRVKFPIELASGEF
ncbi:hypothetical protein LINPERHAP1_LOCUS4677, partial [Linum perenne]